MEDMKFSIRDLLWLTVVCGLGVGWWVDAAGQGNTIQRLQTEHFERIERLGKERRQSEQDVSRLALKIKQIDSALANRGWKYEFTANGAAVWHFLDEADFPHCERTLQQSRAYSP